MEVEVDADAGGGGGRGGLICSLGRNRVEVDAGEGRDSFVCVVEKETGALAGLLSIGSSYSYL